MAKAILSPEVEQPDVKELTQRIETLKAAPKQNDAAWWNDLAGAYLRLGRAAEAVKILEPLTNKFSGDYGIHANLGTGYHLLGRYAEAEREIARDLQINPEAHFGLEKYHLALLQYLCRNVDYQIRHVYVDEFSESFLTYPAHASVTTDYLTVSKLNKEEVAPKPTDQNWKDFVTPSPQGAWKMGDCSMLFRLFSAYDPAPDYTSKWNLGEDSKLVDGVIYMATLNQKEPACWVMLGMVALKRHDIHLGDAAFRKAIELRSPQTPILLMQLGQLGKFHPNYAAWILDFSGGAIVFLIVWYVFSKVRAKHILIAKSNFRKR